MHLLVNTLSIGSMSGNHVVYGFLRPLVKSMLPDHQLTVLHYEKNPPPAELLAAGVQSVAIADSLSHWAKRTLWETTRFARLTRRLGADLVLNVSGALTPRCPVPQVVLCQNPWAFRTIAQEAMAERFKAKLQCIGYAKAFKNAAMMIYISNHLRSLYRDGNPGVPETRSEIAYVGLNEDTYQAARDLTDVKREPLTILSVSAMASWKGAETLVDAVGMLHDRNIPAQLKLVGPWPNPGYRKRIEQQIKDGELMGHVQILGKVSDDELHRLYATSRVYALMSSCESFGIPAAEAMAFGTPVISTTCCAIAEVCEGAGAFGPLADAKWTADAIQRALTDQEQWDVWSTNARRNASRLTWKHCTEPFQRIAELL